MTAPESSVKPAPRPVPCRYAVASTLLLASINSKPPISVPGRVGVNFTFTVQLEPAAYAFAEQEPLPAFLMTPSPEITEMAAGVNAALKVTFTVAVPEPPTAKEPILSLPGVRSYTLLSLFVK